MFVDSSCGVAAVAAAGQQRGRPLQEICFRIFVPTVNSRRSVGELRHGPQSAPDTLDMHSWGLLLTAASLAAAASGHRREILKRQGDYYLRLQNRDGNLVMDEGDIPRDVPLKAPMYIRKKRIAHARDFQKFLNVSF